MPRPRSADDANPRIKKRTKKEVKIKCLFFRAQKEKVAQAALTTTEEEEEEWRAKIQEAFGYHDIENIEKIGSGNYGVVLLVTRRNTAPTTIKICTKNPREDASLGEKLMVDFYKKNQDDYCNHLCKVIKITEIGDKFLFKLEFIEGHDLFDYYEVLTSGKENQPLNRDKNPKDFPALLIIYQIIKATMYMHEHEIAHRDISLENVMYNPKNQTAKLIDFGFASKYTEKQEQGYPVSNFCGKDEYQTPEKIAERYNMDQSPNEAHERNKRQDCYSLCIVIFYLLSIKLKCKHFMGQLDNRGNEITDKGVNPNPSTKNELMELIKSKNQELVEYICGECDNSLSNKTKKEKGEAIDEDDQKIITKLQALAHFFVSLSNYGQNHGTDSENAPNLNINSLMQALIASKADPKAAPKKSGQEADQESDQESGQEAGQESGQESDQESDQEADQEAGQEADQEDRVRMEM